jgi:hypothetical protein
VAKRSVSETLRTPIVFQRYEKTFARNTKKGGVCWSVMQKGIIYLASRLAYNGKLWPLHVTLTSTNNNLIKKLLKFRQGLNEPPTLHPINVNVGKVL